jgi:hypothetical protein
MHITGIVKERKDIEHLLGSRRKERTMKTKI